MHVSSLSCPLINFFLNSVSGSVYFNECALDTSFTTWLIVIGSVQVLLSPCRCKGYSNSRHGQDARKFNSTTLKVVNVLLHVGGIVVPGCIIIYAIWRDDGDPTCTGSDTYPTDPIFPTNSTDPTFSTTDCCNPTVMHSMLSLVIISGILGCLSCCYSRIVSLISSK